MEMINLPVHVRIAGNLIVDGSKPAAARSDMTQDDNAVYPIPWDSWRVWDAQQTNLPGAGATDDLGLIGGTFGAATPSLQTGDVKALGTTTRYARCQFQLPAEYVAGQSVTVRIHGGILLTLPDGAATVDVECYQSNREAGVSADLCAIAAQSIKSLTLADKSFIITPNSLSPGDILDIRVTVTITDAATVSAVTGILGAIDILIDVKG